MRFKTILILMVFGGVISLPFSEQGIPGLSFKYPFNSSYGAEGFYRGSDESDWDAM